MCDFPYIFCFCFEVKSYAHTKRSYVSTKTPAQNTEQETVNYITFQMSILVSLCHIKFEIDLSVAMDNTESEYCINCVVS